MVGRRVLRSLFAAMMLCASTAFVSSAMAAVTAVVDRPSVDLNESFILKIIVDSNIDKDPDLSVLEDDFYLGQVSQLSNTSIINKQINRSRTWSVALMAKATGTSVIPAISIGDEKSEPLSILINEPTTAPPGEADVFVSSEVDQEEAYVQSQILYRIKVYRAVATRQPSLREPTITGVEALIELVGEERSYDALLNGKAYNVAEHVLAIYPQESGEISISPARFEARVLRDGRITGRKVFESASHSIKVLPAPAPPADFPDAVWLPARDVTLTEEWSRQPNEISAGEPVTRHVTISALGQMETQIPATIPPDVDGLNVYTDKPELSRRIETDGIRGVRKDQYAMIGVRGGPVDIPELAVPWWDIEAGEWRVVRLPSRTLLVDAPEEAVVPANVDAPDAVMAAGNETTANGGPGQLATDGLWKKASQLLAAVWLLTVLAWWWSSRDKQTDAIEPPPPPVYRQQAKFVKAARKAAAVDDQAGVRSAIVAWGRLQWPENAPRSIGEVAQRVTGPLSDELRALSAVSYGDGAVKWDGNALAKALRSIKLRQDDDTELVDELLPPLMPRR